MEHSIKSLQNTSEAATKVVLWKRTGTHNHLVHKRTLNHLAKWLNVRLWIKNTFFEDYLQMTASDTSKGILELLLKDFKF